MKHANPTIWPTAEKQEPAHSTGWTRWAEYRECQAPGNGNTGKHAKPFGKHHPATPITPALSHEALIET